MQSPVKRTVPMIQQMKGKQAIVCLTAYDEPFARLADESGVDVILVGDSVGNVCLGMRNTLSVTLEDMVRHTAAVASAPRSALIVADLPIGTYGGSVDLAIKAATKLVRSGAEAVKLEGAHASAIAAISSIGIPVMGHLGMTPQSINRFGGFKVQGKNEQQADDILNSLQLIEDAGAFACVLELVPDELAERATAVSGIPTIGIGAGDHCDGQVQVLHDVLGLSPMKLKHAKKYADLAETVKSAISDYASEVRRAAENPTHR